ncbi:MAG: Hsp70 family protein, partial [Clostridiales bacterium]|nr:Hsp70 family protein [Clostridiales bacterium]
EPTAAAVAYGLYQRNENSQFLVFDLGGGTFDVSVLELDDDIMEVHAVAGDNYLGGEDFTNVILDTFLEEHDIDKNTLTEKERIYLRNQAEKCKCQNNMDSFYRMQAVRNGTHLETIITKKEYEKKTAMLFDRIKQPVRRSLSDAGVRIRDIDEIVLVGGTTRMPTVRKFVGKLFGRMPDTSVNPDEAVALGAAIQGAMKERKRSIREVILTDVCPFTLGTEVSVKTEEGRLENNHFCPILERNTVIPASRTERFYTVYDHQTEVEIHVLQGESRFASNNVSLGTIRLDVPDNKAGEEEISVTYTYDVNALLEVEAKVKSTGETVTKLIQNQDSDMTLEEMQARMKELAHLKIHPRDQEANKVLLLRGERLYEETTGELREQLEMVTRQFEHILDKQDPDKIREAREDYEDALDWIEEEMWTGQ